MQKRRMLNVMCVAAGVVAIFAFSPAPSFAAGDAPAPKPKPKPKPKTKQPNNTDEIYSLGYWQAKRGEHASALTTLRSADDQTDPRVQTMIGFSLRKLGRTEEALGHYQAVLAAYPNRTTTRQYLGEAYLQIGQVDNAKLQLAEIAKRCGTTCDDYQSLANEIVKFE